MRWALLLCVLALGGCTSRTPHGECVGILEEREPELSYRASVWNIVLAVVFSETIVVPLVVVLDEHSCPVGRKPAPAASCCAEAR